MIKDFEENGFLVLKNMFEESELRKMQEVVARFHKSWIKKNSKFYNDKAVNSAYLTGKEHLLDSEREALFKFIGSAKLMRIVTSIMGVRATFMNTQLFFNPVNEGQRNYWHRDPQYHMSIAEQKEALAGPNVIHFRIPLFDEPGVELIPGTHRRWDSEEELNVRIEQNGRKNYENLPTGLEVNLNAGDLLVFSANMIHRGIYGMDRLSLDILFCDPAIEIVKFVEDCCLPDRETMKKLENACAFENAIEIKTNNKSMHATSA
ncbi:phytanoyl-CoA dioxygenase family protein [Pseudomaricurvus alcaniphilus]|uniref:phytanoyl-CoA dioxygenase family protein n=1 Tax=Pseudomaricurvus alcaniphilus TaxID=1166482 RepID=UPI001409CACE|nr:phytanoyl-CoA dioxygenase family protein [Pseudomaricurvus alcaniphilus]NHN37329.1 phytanoyl-CoA dioxygenase family protein [Pseudomaricurvus alcaniphilus]